jgi:small subunit ribosomal protein S17
LQFEHTMSFSCSVQSLHLRSAIVGVSVSHTCSATSRAVRPAVLQIKAAQGLQGKVVSAKNANTIIVNYDSFKEHKLYRKRVRSTSRIVAHDEEGRASAGDYVRIVPCRPVSKTKRFRLDAIIKKFEYIVDEQTGEVAALGNYEEDPAQSVEQDSQEELGIPAEQLA